MDMRKLSLDVTVYIKTMFFMSTWKYSNQSSEFILKVVLKVPFHAYFQIFIIHPRLQLSSLT